jgi:hypothetical protein
VAITFQFLTLYMWGIFMKSDSAGHRKNTRTQVWPDVKATLKINDPHGSGRKTFTFVGRIGDLGGMGMFFITRESVPVPAKAEITVDFNLGKKSDMVLSARGETVRKTSEGVGIKFTDIDLSHLQKCILARMNQ